MAKKIVFLVGSLRKKSFNKVLANYIASQLPAEYQTDSIQIADIPLLNQDTEFPTPTAVKDFRQKVAAADGLWIVSPEYNGTIPGGLKNALDWLSRPTEPGKQGIPQFLLKKPVAISGAGGRAKTSGTRKDLVRLLKYMGLSPLEDTVGLQVSGEAFATDNFSLSSEQKEEVKQEVKKFVAFIEN